MRRKKKNGIEWLEFELLSDIPELVHGVILRHGGVSEGHCSSLNIGGNTGDQWENIQENRKRALDALGIFEAVSSYQVHSDRVVHVMTKNPPDVGEADGLMTQVADLGLLIKHADCQAAIFYDPRNKALANVHAGWRGNVKNIYAKTVDQMKEAFGSSAEDLLVCISPSLGPSRSEFKNYREELPEHFWKFQISPTYFDLWAIARMQLEECGVRSKHIEIASICTYSAPDDFFSYRRDKPTGRNATVAALKS
ncbi:MAG: peptidoglycan editing factor PgeF [Verrucomicrobia bacterium]|nr:peptidoglycan editing factor PgeF [Verrucomicrobiota bacterium]